jgi:cyclopropane fatty-acyl-phospholipid synthase-like methyltransferase
MVERGDKGDLDRFREWYRVDLDVLRAIEVAVIGSDYGADGYATIDEVDTLGRLLFLGPGDRLLDMGTGRGWPGLYLAATTGCAVVGADLPLEGLVRGMRRATADGLGDRSAMVTAGGDALPFRRGCFDAIVHTDVLC